MPPPSAPRVWTSAPTGCIEAGRAGSFDLSGGYTHVIKHTIQLSADQPVDDQLTDLYYYVIPKDKATYSAGWTLGKFTTTIHGNWLGGLPNYDGTERLQPDQVYNASMVYRFTERGTFTFFVDNLFDEKPPRDPTWTATRTTPGTGSARWAGRTSSRSTTASAARRPSSRQIGVWVRGNSDPHTPAAPRSYSGMRPRLPETKSSHTPYVFISLSSPVSCTTLFDLRPGLTRRRSSRGVRQVPDQDRGNRRVVL